MASRGYPVMRWPCEYLPVKSGFCGVASVIRVQEAESAQQKRIFPVVKLSPFRWPGHAALLAGVWSASCVALSQTLAPVSVTATRTELPPFEVPASVDVIDGERVRSDGRSQINLAESLALVPGLLARDRQNQAQDLQLSVRGFGAR